MKNFRPAIAMLLLGALGSLAPICRAAGVPPAIAAAVADAHRPQADRARDALRKPAETIAFAGLAPGGVIGELLPGEGYFTRIFAGVVGKRVKYPVAGQQFADDPPGFEPRERDRFGGLALASRARSACGRCSPRRRPRWRAVRRRRDRAARARADAAIDRHVDGRQKLFMVGSLQLAAAAISAASAIPSVAQRVMAGSQCDSPSMRAGCTPDRLDVRSV